MPPCHAPVADEPHRFCVTGSRLLDSFNYVSNTIATPDIPDSDERLLATGTTRLTHWPMRQEGYGSMRLSCPARSTTPTSSPPPSLTRSNESSAEPRVAVRKDCAVKFYDVNVRGADGSPKRISGAGTYGLTCP